MVKARSGSAEVARPHHCTVSTYETSQEGNINLEKFQFQTRERKPPKITNETTNMRAVYGLPRLSHSRQLLGEY
jgi:hypothetical protein